LAEEQTYVSNADSEDPVIPDDDNLVIPAPEPETTADNEDWIHCDSPDGASQHRSGQAHVRSALYDNDSDDNPVIPASEPESPDPRALSTGDEVGDVISVLNSEDSINALGGSAHLGLEWVSSTRSDATLGTDTITLNARGQQAVLNIAMDRIDPNIEKYILEITYTSTDPALIADNPGAFNISAYNGNPTPPQLASVITGSVTATGTDNTRKLTYTELSLPTNNTAMSVTFSVPNNPYNGQILNITATLKAKDDPSQYEQATATIDFDYQYFSLNRQIVLSAGATLLTGEHITPVRFYTNLYTSPSNFIGNYTAGVYWIFNTITYSSLNDVNIKINNVTKTYAQLLTEYAANPLDTPVLFYRAGVDIAASPTAYIHADEAVDIVGSEEVLQIKTTDDFAAYGNVVPTINFPISIRPTINATIGGHPYTFISGDPLLGVNDSNLTITAIDKTLVITAQNLSASHITYNSAQYQSAYTNNLDEGHLYHQELCRLHLRNYETTARDVNVTLTVPTGVTLTHLRLSKTDAENQLTSLTLTSGGSTATFTPSDSNYTLIALPTPITAGNTLTFKINGLIDVIPSSYNWNTGLHFIGITDTDAAMDSQVNFAFTATRVDNTSITSNSSIKANVSTNNYCMVYPYITAPVSVAKGGSMQIGWSSIAPNPGPYHSNTRFDISNPFNVLTDPVVYLSLPSGVSIQDYAMKNPAVAVDAKGRPLTIELTNSWEGKGFWGNDGGSLYEFTYEIVGAPSAHVYIQELNSATNTPVVINTYIEPDFVGNNINFSAGTWFVGSRLAQSVHTSNYGVVSPTTPTFPWPEASEMNSNSVQLGNGGTANVLVTTPQTLIVNGAASKGGSYTYYSPGSITDSLPQVHTNTEGNSYKLYLFNGVSSAFTDAQTYFVLPQTPQGGVVPITGEPEITSTLSGDYTVYYTTADVDANDVGLDGSSLTSSGEAVSGSDWEVLYSGSDASITPSLPSELSGWDAIKALRVEIPNFATSKGLSITMPYTTPLWNVAKGVVNGAIAEGATLHYYGPSTFGTSDITAALKINEASLEGRFYVDEDYSGDYTSGEMWVQNAKFSLSKDSDDSPFGLSSGYLTGTSGSVVIHDLADFALKFTAEMPSALAAQGYYFIPSHNPTNPNDVAVTDDTGYVPNAVTPAPVYFGIAKPHKVTYKLNGGIGSVPEDTTKYHHTDTVDVDFETIPTKFGYDFSGWARTSNALGPEFVSGDVEDFPITENTELFAMWSPKSALTLNFHKNSADAIDGVLSKPVTFASAVGTLPSIDNGAPIRTGYTFSGWSEVAGSSNTANFTASKVVDFDPDKTVYAVWSPDYTDRSYWHRLSYNANGATSGNIPAAAEYVTGSDAIVSGNSGSLVRTGYVFDSWNIAADGSGTGYSVGGVLNMASDTVLYAKWSKVPYTVSYAAGGSSVTGLPHEVTRYINDSYTVSSAAPSREGYTFEGWVGTSGISGSYEGGDVFSMPASNVVLTASWKVVPEPPIIDPPVVTPTVFSVSYDGGGSSVTGLPAGASLEEGESYRIPQNSPVREGYDFLGWTATSGLRGSYKGGSTFVMPAADVVLTASWDSETSIVTKTDEKKAPVGKIDEPKEPESAVGKEALVQASRAAGIPILPGGVPLYAPKDFGAWALLDLVLAALGVVLLAITLFNHGQRRKQEGRLEELGYQVGEDRANRRLPLLLASAVMAIVGVIVFVLTQDMSLPMVLVDKWTIVMAIIFALEFLFANRANRAPKEADEYTEATAV
jgi:uncharacterized repeat protein (TIGR02543 family)